MGADQTAIERRKEIKDMTPLQENLQMAKRTGQRAFDYAMNAKEEANKLLLAMQATYDSGDAKSMPTYREMIAAKHDRLTERAQTILEAATMISDALDKLYGLDMAEFF